MSVYSKNLAGVNQRVFVNGADVEYTTDATYALFIENAAEGEMGVFLTDGTVKSDALSGSTEFFVAQKRDGYVAKTPLIKWSDLKRKVKTAYAAPVNQISYIGYAATGSADINFSFTGASGTTPLTFGIALSETTPGNQPFPVQEGYVTVTSTTQDEYAALATIVSQINGDTDYQRIQPDRFVKAEIVTNGALGAEFVEDPTVTYLSKTVTFAGNVTVATGAHVKFEGVAGPTYKVATGVTAGTSITLDRPYQGTSATIDVSATSDLAGTFAYTSGTTLLGVKFTTLNVESHFKVRALADLYTANPTITNSTAWLLGSGSAASVLEAEKEGRFFDGVGSVVNAAFAADYGLPTLFTDSSKTYDLYILDFSPSDFPSAALPNYDQKLIERLYIAAQSSGTGAGSELTTIFGF